MAKSKSVNLHEQTAKELQSLIEELERSVQEARLRLAAGKLDKPSQIWQQAAQLARAKTVLREQQLVVAEQE